MIGVELCQVMPHCSAFLAKPAPLVNDPILVVPPARWHDIANHAYILPPSSILEVAQEASSQQRYQSRGVARAILIPGISSQRARQQQYSVVRCEFGLRLAIANNLTLTEALQEAPQ